MLKKQGGTACSKSYRIPATGMFRGSGNHVVADEERNRICPMCKGMPVLSGISRREVTWIGGPDSDLYGEHRCRIGDGEKENAAIRLTLLSDIFETPDCSWLDFILDYAVGFQSDTPLRPGNAVTGQMVWEQFGIKVKVVNSLTRKIAAFYENCTKYKAKGLKLAAMLGKGVYQYRIDLEYRVSCYGEAVPGDLSVPLIAEAYCTAYMGNQEDGSLRQGSLTKCPDPP